jgi:AraC family transcriptional activator of mar-sox-rob regulon
MLWSVSLRAGEATPWHAHDVVEMVCCLEGSGGIEIEAHKIDFVPGRSVVIAPGVRHRYVFAAGEAVALKMVCMNEADVASFLSPAQAALLAGTRTAVATFADHPAGDEGLAHTLALIPDAFGIDDAQELRVAWGAIGLLLALHGKRCAPLAAHGRPRHASKIDEIRTWLEAHLGDGVGLDETATRFGLSRSLLTREFRRHTGKSFVDYCNTRRVEKAALGLVADRRPIIEVALEAGFANLSHFHRQFKNHYGLTPASFRRQIAGQPADGPVLEAAV